MEQDSACKKEIKIVNAFDMPNGNFIVKYKNETSCCKVFCSAGNGAKL